MPLITLEIYTTMGSLYSFPDVERSDALERAIRGVEHAKGSDALVLVNASDAVLTLPMRVVDRVRVAGEGLPLVVRSR